MNKELMALTFSHMSDNDISIKALADKIGFSRSTLSRWLNGKYDSDCTCIEEAISNYLQVEPIMAEALQANEDMNVPPIMEAEEVKEAKKTIEKKQIFFESTDARAILGVCSSCQQESGLGIIIGRSGLGKTHSLKQYARLAKKTVYIECDDMMSCRDLIQALEKALSLPKGAGTNWNRINSIRDFLSINPGYLIIIDEADKLVTKFTQKKMEILRGIYDQAEVGLIIAGEPMLEILIKNYLNRFANRIDFYLALRGLSKSETDRYLSNYDIEHDALIELEHRAMNPTNGCFRLLDRTLNNVIRLLKDKGETTITLKSIQQASSMMMI